MASAERRCAARGMTLIEVLVALAIVAVALAAGLKAAGALTNNAQRLANVTVAQWCAENQLVNMKLLRVFPGFGDSRFSCEQIGIALEGKVSVRPTPNPNFRRIDVQMLDDGGLPVVTLTTILPRY
jgi:general secretion pathway protein I